MSKVDRWIEQQYYEQELRIRKQRKGVSTHKKDCRCSFCLDAKYYAGQEAESRSYWGS